MRHPQPNPPGRELTGRARPPGLDRAPPRPIVDGTRHVAPQPPSTAELVGSLIARFEAQHPGAASRSFPDAQPVLDALMRALAANPSMAGRVYAGHMNTQPLWPAVVGGLLADLYGINMLVPDQSGVAWDIEREVVSGLCHLMGLTGGGGRLTGGGTISNLEAIYLASRAMALRLRGGALGHTLGLEAPGALQALPSWAESLLRALRVHHGPDAPRILGETLDAPWPDRPPMAVLIGRNAHYSIRKAVRIIGDGALRAVPVDVDAQQRMSTLDLRRQLLALRDAGTAVVAVISTAGTTATGSVDPLEDVAELAAEHGFWWHIDAAYGGHFRAGLFAPGTELRLDAVGAPFAQPELTPVEVTRPRSALPDTTLASLTATGGATSISIDPHKLGFVPNGCGALLLNDPRWAGLIGDGAGYFQEEPDFELQLSSRAFTRSGIEGTRSGRAPLSTYALHRTLPLHRDGLGALLERGVMRAREAWTAVGALRQDGLTIRPLHTPDTNIFCAVILPDGGNLDAVNRATGRFADGLHRSGALFCTRMVFHRDDAEPLFTEVLPDMGVPDAADGHELVTLRFVFANPDLLPDWPQRFERAARPLLTHIARSLT